MDQESQGCGCTHRDWNMSQMHFGRLGQITEEMAYVAEKKNISAELVHIEITKGTMIIPANINHPELEPVAIGIESLCKISTPTLVTRHSSRMWTKRSASSTRLSILVQTP